MYDLHFSQQGDVGDIGQKGDDGMEGEKGDTGEKVRQYTRITLSLPSQQ